MSALNLDEAIEFSAAPRAVRTAVERLLTARPDLTGALYSDRPLAAAVVAVAGASRELATLIAADPEAPDVLGDLDRRRPVDAAGPDALRRWKDREYLHVAAHDLLGLDDLRATVAAVSALGEDVLRAAHTLAAPGAPLAVIGMGKLGGRELNYASDIDVMFVGEGDAEVLDRAARRVLDIAGGCFRVDTNLRPLGRDGPLVRSMPSYEAYWDRWAQPWEFQALLKARAVAGDAALGRTFDEVAAGHLWRRTFSSDDLRSLRHLKARVEAELHRRGLADREVKRGRGGIRDVEFAVQLLQLVHGRLDDDVRSPTTLVALEQLAVGGYVEADDAATLTDAYGFLRGVEHRLQLYDGTQVYAVPSNEADRTRIARTLGYRDTATTTALAQLDTDFRRHQGEVRSIHERLYFRPLLEAFAGADQELLARPGALEARLSAFGFSDGLRTRAAVRELTRGLTRSSHLMQQMLPLLFGWLADAPDPDLGLLCLRNLSGSPRRAAEMTRAFRESPEAARRLCLLVGTTRLAADILQGNLDLVGRLPDPVRLRTAGRSRLIETAGLAISLKEDDSERQAALLRWKERNLVGIMARDVMGEADVAQVGGDLTRIAEAALEVALGALRPTIPFTVIALGRFGGGELSYASDLDLVFVYDGTAASHHEEGLRLAAGLRRFVQGATPATRLWEVDVDLRPEGKQGPLARSLDGYQKYFQRWALAWERQAMLRARVAAGDPNVGARFTALLADFVWEPGLSADDTREIRRIKARIERERMPAGDDPQFHLKLGRGALADVEWTAQLLQLQHGVASPGTVDALGALVRAGALDPRDSQVLTEAYRFCEATRNRSFLVRGTPGDALPQQASQLLWLARSLDTTPAELREHYRRVTRRSRAVFERLFYGRT